jgi:hypothetical protein
MLLLAERGASGGSPSPQGTGRGEKFITHGFASKLVAALQDEAGRKSAAAAIKLSVRENQIVRLLLAAKAARLKKPGGTRRPVFRNYSDHVQELCPV